jgi:hypothetical protein
MFPLQAMTSSGGDEANLDEFRSEVKAITIY